MVLPPWGPDGSANKPCPQKFCVLCYRGKWCCPLGDLAGLLTNPAHRNSVFCVIGGNGVALAGLLTNPANEPLGPSVGGVNKPSVS